MLLWALAVPTASMLGVLALRAAGGDSSAAILSASDAASLATASPGTSGSAPGSASPRPAPGPAATSDPATPVGDVEQRRVPGAVLGLRCEQSTPVLVWSVPDPGWRVEQVERDDGDLRVRLEADDDDVRVTVACRDEVPEVVRATRDEE